MFIFSKVIILSGIVIENHNGKLGGSVDGQILLELKCDLGRVLALEVFFVEVDVGESDGVLDVSGEVEDVEEDAAALEVHLLGFVGANCDEFVDEVLIHEYYYIQY